MVRLATLATALGLFIGLMVWLWFTYVDHSTFIPEVGGDVMESLEVDIAAVDVELVQGEQGRLIFHLRAENATYDEELKRILVRSPHVTYHMGAENADGAPLEITAPYGDLNQNTNAVSFGPAVRARYGEYSITGQTLRYDGASRIRISGDVVVDREGAVLKAPEIVFNINSNIVSASGGVQLDIEGSHGAF